MSDAAKVLSHLRSTLDDRPEPLRGDWGGHHGIRVNPQWRVVFRWPEGHAHEVRIVDHHRG